MEGGSVDPDQMQLFGASELDLHCLHNTTKWIYGLKGLKFVHTLLIVSSEVWQKHYFSFQDTLAEATALLTELENCTDMDTNGNPVVTGDGDDSVLADESTSGQSDTHMSSIEEEKKDSEKTW